MQDPSSKVNKKKSSDASSTTVAKLPDYHKPHALHWMDLFTSILKWAKAYEAGSSSVTDAHYDGYVSNLKYQQKHWPKEYAEYLIIFPDFEDDSWHYTGSFFNKD